MFEKFNQRKLKWNKFLIEIRQDNKTKILEEDKIALNRLIECGNDLQKLINISFKKDEDLKKYLKRINFYFAKQDDIIFKILNYKKDLVKFYEKTEKISAKKILKVN